MKIQVIAIGATREPFVKEGLAEYLGRMRGARSVEWVEVKAEPGDRADGRAREAERALAKIPAGALVVALDEHGETSTSEGFAARIASAERAGERQMTFVIGSAYGLDPSVASRSRFTLSLSRMTFPHELVRVMLAEQLYRAFQIQSGTGYHHGEPSLACGEGAPVRKPPASSHRSARHTRTGRA